MESTDISWRKSSYSSNGGDACIEVGLGPDAVLVRDTKDHGRGQVHSFTPEEWCAFVTQITNIVGLRTTRGAVSDAAWPLNLSFPRDPAIYYKP